MRAFEGRWREALAFVSAHWPAVQAVGDALWKRRSLAGDEVGEIIEQVEARTRQTRRLVDDILGRMGRGRLRVTPD